jgi:antitoxin VapB
MTTAKLFKHGGSQAVRLPKAFRFEGSEVIIEKRGDSVVLKPKSSTFGDVIRELQAKFPDADKFPEIERPKKHERPALEW